MTVSKEVNGSEAILAIDGRVDTITSVQLESEIKECVDNVDKIILDFKDVDYISSAGLRVLLSTHKLLSAKGGLHLINVQPSVADIFDVTGFCDILNIG